MGCPGFALVWLKRRYARRSSSDSDVSMAQSIRVVGGGLPHDERTTATITTAVWKLLLDIGYEHASFGRAASAIKIDPIHFE